MNNKPDKLAAPPAPPAMQELDMRDYFAIHADLSQDITADGCIGDRIALNLMDGITLPNWDDDHLSARRWWAEAESRLRYMKADAMLKARQA